jgi:hypothetical protein
MASWAEMGSTEVRKQERIGRDLWEVLTSITKRRRQPDLVETAGGGQRKLNQGLSFNKQKFPTQI